MEVTEPEDELGEAKAKEQEEQERADRLNVVKWGLTREQSEDCSL